MSLKPQKLSRRQSMELFAEEEYTAPSQNPPKSHSDEDFDSPAYILYSTQELREDVDVLWDYSSPQSKPKTIQRRPQKPLKFQQSPKVPLRRHNSKQIKQDLCKVREEMRALKAEIAKPDHEESLILSPREEAMFKMPLLDILDEDIEDPFDDDMDDKLLIFSQQILEENTHENTQKNDTFDMESYNQLTQIVDIKKSSKTITRSVSAENNSISKVQWHRTQSFENYQNGEVILSKDKLEEIERKRLEAKAKLEAKKLIGRPPEGAVTSLTNFIGSPLHCSHEEIEKKRLEALAKREAAKRQQEIIEKNKREALKRREESRRKMAAEVKNCLSTRL